MTHVGLARVVLIVLAVASLAAPAGLLAKGGVYYWNATTNPNKHANPTTGPNRDANYAIGECMQCHVAHSGNADALFAANDNNLCYTAGCHNNPGARGIYQGPNLYNTSKHATTTSTLWPGADATVDSAAPAARAAGDWGECLNCHDPHGYNMDGTGLIPSLLFSREEKLCYVCHDGSPANDAKSDFTKTVRHPVANNDTLRRTGSWVGWDGVTRTQRTVECTDCHNAHTPAANSHAYATTATATRNQVGTGPLYKVGGVNFNYAGLANWPTYASTWYTGSPITYSTGVTYEWQVCFVCHSSYYWTNGTPPNGLSSNGMVANPVETDVAQAFSPGNNSGHPVLTGLNNYPNSPVPKALTAAAMAAPWATNLGTQTMMCSDCHNTDAASPAAQGPHGSAVAFMLRGPNTYWPTDSVGNKYNLGNNTSGTAFLAGLFCLNCHPMRPTSTTWVNNVHTEHSGPQGNFTPDQNACVSCHIVIPHGGKV